MKNKVQNHIMAVLIGIAASSSNMVAAEQPWARLSQEQIDRASIGMAGPLVVMPPSQKIYTQCMRSRLPQPSIQITELYEQDDEIIILESPDDETVKRWHTADMECRNALSADMELSPWVQVFLGVALREKNRTLLITNKITSPIAYKILEKANQTQAESSRTAKE